MTISRILRAASPLLVTALVLGASAPPAAATEAEPMATLPGISGDELLDAVPYPPGADREAVKAARKEKVKRDRAAAVASEFGDAPEPEPEPEPRLHDQVGSAFAVDPDQVLALRAEGVGWGAIVKLHQIAHAKDVPVADLLAGIEKAGGEYAFDFGELRRSLTAEERARMDDKPRSVGALRSNRPDHAGPKAKADKDAAKAEREAAKGERKAQADGDDEDDGDEGRKGPKPDKPNKADKPAKADKPDGDGDASSEDDDEDD